MNEPRVVLGLFVITVCVFFGVYAVFSDYLSDSPAPPREEPPATKPKSKPKARKKTSTKRTKKGTK